MTTETKPKSPQHVEIRWGDGTPGPRARRSLLLSLVGLVFLALGWTLIPLILSAAGVYYAGKTLGLGLGSRKFAAWALAVGIAVFIAAAAVRITLVLYGSGVLG